MARLVRQRKTYQTPAHQKIFEGPDMGKFGASRVPTASLFQDWSKKIFNKQHADKFGKPDVGKKQSKQGAYCEPVARLVKPANVEQPSSPMMLTLVPDKSSCFSFVISSSAFMSAHTHENELVNGAERFAAEKNWQKDVHLSDASGFSAASIRGGIRILSCFGIPKKDLQRHQ